MASAPASGPGYTPEYTKLGLKDCCVEKLKILDVQIATIKEIITKTSTSLHKDYESTRTKFQGKHGEIGTGGTV